ncbi:MAG: hypothetical protein KBB83_05735 [Alphaproteobacteria bacterium]|nr:hypothetical protein [Alphaproteobacteria bacterium]
MKKIIRFLSAFILTGSAFASDKIIEDDIIKRVIQIDNGILVEYTFPNMMVFKNGKGSELSVKMANEAIFHKGDPLFGMPVANDAKFKANMNFEEFQEGVRNLGAIAKMWDIKNVYTPDDGRDWEHMFVLESGIVLKRQSRQISYQSMSRSVVAFEEIKFLANDPERDMDLTEDVILTLDMSLDQFRQNVAKLGMIQSEQRCIAKPGKKKVNAWPEEDDEKRRCCIQ